MKSYVVADIIQLTSDTEEERRYINISINNLNVSFDRDRVRWDQLTLLAEVRVKFISEYSITKANNNKIK